MHYSLYDKPDKPGGYDDQYHGYMADVPFWLEIANRYASKEISTLEMAAGTGRITFEFVNAGYPIDGVDLSKDMLRVAQLKADKLNGDRFKVTFTHGNMIDYKTEKKRRLITVPFTAFQHLLTTEEQIAALINMREQLSEDGRIVIDIMNPNPVWLAQGLAQFKQPIENKRIKLPTGETLVRRQVTHYETSTQQLKWIFYIDVYDTDGELDYSYTEEADVAAIFPREWRLLHELAGLQIEHEYGDYQFGKFEGNSPRILFVCKKG